MDLIKLKTLKYVQNMEQQSKTKTDMYTIETKTPKKTKYCSSEGEDNSPGGGGTENLIQNHWKLSFLKVHKSARGWIEVLADLYHPTRTITTPEPPHG